MYFLGLIFAPICAVQIVDFYAFRKNTLHLPSLYRLLDEGPVLLLGRREPGGLPGHGRRASSSTGTC